MEVTFVDGVVGAIDAGEHAYYPLAATFAESGRVDGLFRVTYSDGHPGRTGLGGLGFWPESQ